jgi:hypothetical protein
MGSLQRGQATMRRSPASALRVVLKIALEAFKERILFGARAP